MLIIFSNNFNINKTNISSKTQQFQAAKYLISIQTLDAITHKKNGSPSMTKNHYHEKHKNLILIILQ